MRRIVYLGGLVPPDPELAVGPDHVIAVVNIAVAIYDKAGELLVDDIRYGLRQCLQRLSLETRRRPSDRQPIALRTGLLDLDRRTADRHRRRAPTRWRTLTR